MKYLIMFVATMVAGAVLAQVLPVPTKVKISWAPVTTWDDGSAMPAGTAVTYEVWTAKCGQSLILAATNPTTTDTFSIRTPTPGQCYHWAVRARVGTGPVSALSDEVMFTLPIAPPTPAKPTGVAGVMQ